MGWDTQTLSDNQRHQVSEGRIWFNRCPILPDQLILLKAQWMKSSSYVGIILWAAACFGCFRASEITAPAIGSFDSVPTRHHGAQCKTTTVAYSSVETVEDRPILGGEPRDSWLDWVVAMPS